MKRPRSREHETKLGAEGSEVTSHGWAERLGKLSPKDQGTVSPFGKRLLQRTPQSTTTPPARGFGHSKIRMAHQPGTILCSVGFNSVLRGPCHRPSRRIVASTGGANVVDLITYLNRTISVPSSPYNGYLNSAKRDF